MRPSDPSRRARGPLLYSPDSGAPWRSSMISPKPLGRSWLTLHVPNELDDIWSGVQAELRAAVPESTYAIWLAPLRLHAFGDDCVVLVAPDDTQRWVSARFARVLQTSTAAVLGPAVTVEVIRASDAQAERQREGRGPGHAPWVTPADAARGGVPGFEAADTVNPKHTFDQYVIGTHNRMAHAAALAVAEQPGQAYNPLFIYGPPGLGKTHLLHSIANYIREHGDGLTVRCATVEEFTNAFVGALQHGSVEAFKRRFRDTDVLLIDDIQFLESKARTEEEFFHTFNALYEAGAQLVLTSDRLPRDMAALEARLRERFEAGLVADIQPPDLPTRLAILRKRAQHDGIEPADDTALAVIAEHVESNVRALEGALIRVVAFSSLTGRPLTTELAREVLGSLYPRAPRAGHARSRTIAEIQQATCAHFGLTAEELLSSTRTPRIAWPRQLAMYLARELTGASLPAIGREFGGRDHTTVLHACRRASKRLASDDGSRKAVEKLFTDLGGGPA
jgi:chromosomal replication initiator protein